MRPHRLELAGFGAFAGVEVVDFDALAELGLFVVSGPTGAGKTTVFDAMAYAIYGGLPAGRPSSEVRSHHAGPTDPCRVELTFSVEGRTHVVRRTPDLVRPKRRGTGTTVEPATAELFAVDDDGTEHPLASGTRQVTDACVALVGLDSGQFERVVLLPQGRFQQFLLADTKDRRPLLQQLFGTALYRRAVDELKRRAGDLATQVHKVEADIDHHRRNAKDHLRAVAAGLASEELDGVHPDDDLDLLEAFWQKLAPAVEEVQQLARTLAEEAAAATRTATAARTTALGWDQRAGLLARREALDLAAADVARWRTVAEAAWRAAPVVAAGAVLDAAARTLESAAVAAAAAGEALAARLRDLELTSGADPDPDAADRAVELARADLERVASLLDRLDEARRVVAERERAVAALAALRSELADEQTATDTLHRELTARRTSLAPVAAGAGALATRVEVSTERLTARRRLERAGAEAERHRASFRTTEDHLAAVLAAFVAGAAPRLAAALRPGAPCPVCGSEEHPAPAPLDDEHAHVDVAALEAAQRATAKASSAVAAADRAVAELTQALGPDADLTVAALDAEHQELVREERAAAAAVRELSVVEGELEQAVARQGALAARAAQLVTDQATATAAVASASARVSELTAEVGDADRARLAPRADALADAARSIAACRTTMAAQSVARGAHEHAAAALVTALESSGFDDLDAAREVWVSPVELAQLEQRVIGHDTGAQQVEGGLAALADTDLPEERPDAEALEALAADLRRRTDQLGGRVERLLERGEQAQAAIAKAQAIEHKHTGLREVRDQAERVAQICDGQGPGKIGLETWVLAGELDRVTEAANVHLARMTTGRFQLLRTDDAGHRAKQAGLDLAVFDSHTGRARPPATLSGGEQFQASLALALGLADVVSLGGVGSGRRFEALFVDEGFGSLDPAALDQAVDALHQIHASGRMVGVITHVEAMKQQLPTGIAVAPRADGRGSTLGPA